MGQIFPLPERIPKPDIILANQMINWGFKLRDDGKEYIEYDMPNGWKLVDKSSMYDIPDFYFVDQNKMAKIRIHGIWRGDYYNELEIMLEGEPFKCDSD